jgi:hypothetical protein
MANSYYQLVMKTGPTPGKSFPLEKSEIHLGRDVANEVFVNDAEVSRRHARLTVQAGNFMLEDLGSTNGTFVNGQRLTGPRMLRPGDVIQLGENVSLSFEPPQYDPNATMVSEPGTVIAPAPMAASQPPVQQPAYVPPAQPPQQPEYVPSAAPPQQPAYVPPAPPPQQPAYVPPAPPPVQPAYAGRVPPSPAEPFMEDVKPRRTWLWVSCGCLIILLCLFLAAILWYIDSNFLWCNVMPFLPGCGG